MEDIGPPAGTATRAPPVLVILFNRPAVTRRLIAALRLARVRRLFAAFDGPRPGIASDVERCREVLAVIDEVDWPCEVRVLRRERNLGLQEAVVSGIDWFFEHEQAGIVLEDDCIPAPELFPFAGELLDRYADQAQVMHISASNLRPAERFSAHSYFFAEVGHVWGWATWRRAWERYARSLDDWPTLREELHGATSPLRRALARKFDSTHAGRKVTWSRRWYYTLVRDHGLAVVPAANLVENVGMGADATHRTSARNPLRQEVGELSFPLSHPGHLVPNQGYERHLARYHARSYAARTRERGRIVLDALASVRLRR